MNKTLFDVFFKRIEKGKLSVCYWDGDEVCYGDGSGDMFRICFTKRPPLSGLLDDPVLTLGELYMDGDIAFQGDIDRLMRLMSANALRDPIDPGLLERVSSAALAGFKSVKDKVRQKENIGAHYDLGNDFFSLWLDETMSYSCGYFKTPDDSLYQAQLQKIDLVLKKMRLVPGMRLLDIGCGWGWLILRAAKQYGVKALGITLSEEQCAGAKKRIAEAGLDDLVEVRLINYLDLDSATERFDRVVSVGMFEHVGRDYLTRYMKKVADLLVPGGVSMLHTLTSLKEYETNSWIKKYIFPGGYIPSFRETVALFSDRDFRVLHVESLRRHYAKTLEWWYDNFMARLDRVREMFDERFVRMWALYLQSSAASLRVGDLDIHQIVFSKGVNNELPMTLEDIYAAD